MTITSFRPLALLSTAVALCLSPILSGCAGGGSTSGSTIPSTPVTPAASLTIAAVSPTNVPVGSNDTTVSVTGTGFTTSSVIALSGTAEPTTYVSPTEVRAIVSAAQLKTGAVLSIAVSNGSTVVKADATTVALSVDNPVPTLTSVAPSAVLIGSAATIVTVTGTNFVPGVALSVNGTPRDTTYVSDTKLTAALAADDFATAKSLPLNVINPKPGGGTSGTSALAVNNPAPVIASLSPNTAVVGSSAMTVTVIGSGFLPGSSTVLQINGVTRAATYVDSAHITVGLTAADLSVAGNLAFTLTNAQPGGGASSASSFSVTAKAAPTPAITSVSPTTFVNGGADTSITVRGTNLQSTSKVMWGGTQLTTSYVYGVDNYNVYPYTYSYYLSAQVPASLLTTNGTVNISVNTPGATASSNSLPVSITDPPAPTISGISPNYGPYNSDTKITVAGTGFTTGSFVSVNGKSLTTTYTSSTTLSAIIPAASIQQPGNAAISVSTPAPGGGTSTNQIFSAYIPLVNNSAVYNPSNGLWYVSVPGSVGSPLGNSIVSVNPQTGAFGTPIPVGSEPNKLALTSDGKYLWVGLDGSSSVRKVDLTTNTAGLQFNLQSNNVGWYANPPTVLALAALPGTSDSVVIYAPLSYSYNSSAATSLTIYDSGVARNGGVSPSFSVYALKTDSTRSELYAIGSGLGTYTYGSSGLTSKATNTNATVASSSQDEVQLLSGKLYTDFGTVLDAESGSLLGTFYNSGKTIAQGASLTDSLLSKEFMLDSSSGYYSSGYNQIQIFDPSTYTNTGSSIPINVPSSIGNIYSVAATRLTRWGANGLTFRTGFGIYSLQSNLVNDLSNTNADLSLTSKTSGGSTTGANGVFTISVSNSGPSAATDVVVSAQVPGNGVLVSAVASSGTCSISAPVNCTIGDLSSGSSATVTFTVLETASGSATVTAAVSGSTTDPVSSNNSTAATIAVTGNAYNLSPVINSISPASIQAGARDTVITIKGQGFSSSSNVTLDGLTLSTNYVSSTQLTATVPAAKLSSLGWSAVTVANPAPGGGTSQSMPLTVFNVLTLGANHILYDPYSRKLMTSVGSGSSSVAGNSIATIDAETGTIGSPVSIGSQPTKMALTDDGQILYTILSGANSVARYNMLAGSADYTYAFASSYQYYASSAPRDVAALPGTENTIAVDLGSYTGNALFDFTPASKTASMRGSVTGSYTGSCLQFLNSSYLLSFDIDTTGSTLNRYPVTSSGFTYSGSGNNGATLLHFGCFKVNGGLAFANGGGIANPSTFPATQIGVLAGVSGGGFSNSQALAADRSLQLAFYPASNGSYSNGDGITTYDLNTFLPMSTLSLNMSSIEGNTSYTDVDLVRWGQDGLAMLTSGGHIYLLRGPVVVPQLLNKNTAAMLSTSSTSTISHGGGNVLLTLTGSNFIPGVAVTWNGSYRTTTIVDATHVTVAIPASDLASAGTGSLVATNPGAPASSALTVTVQ